MADLAVLERRQFRCLAIPGHFLRPPLMHLRNDIGRLVERAEHGGDELAADLGRCRKIVAPEDMRAAGGTEESGEVLRRVQCGWVTLGEGEVLFADAEPGSCRRT